MTTQATITLDSGCLFGQKTSPPLTYQDVGYFQSDDSTSDIWIYRDGGDLTSQTRKLGTSKEPIEVFHTDRKGEPKGTVIMTPSMRTSVLHWKDLYGEKVDIDPSKFDCILRFHSGEFRASMIKPRLFREYALKAMVAGNQRTKHTPPIAHNIVVHYRLEDGDVLKLASGKKTIWSSARVRNLGDWLDLEVVADNSTASKFFCTSCSEPRDSYWIPNPGDPPPTWVP